MKSAAKDLQNITAWVWVAAGICMCIALIRVFTEKPKAPAAMPVIVQEVTAERSSYGERVDVGDVDLYTFGGTYDGKVGFLVPGHVGGHFRLMDSKGNKQIGDVWIDAASGAVIVNAGNIRVGIDRQIP